jgi:hypothetical protein
MTARLKRQEFRTRDKAPMEASTRKHDVSLFAQSLIDKKLNLTQELKTAPKLKETQEQEPVQHLTNKQLVVEHKLKRKLVVLIQMQQVLAEIKHNQTDSPDRRNVHLLQTESLQTESTTLHRHVE